MAKSATIYDPQLGNVPADQSKIIYLDKDIILDLPPKTFIVVVDRLPHGGKFTQITTAGQLDLMHKLCVERNIRWDSGKDKRPYEQIKADEQPFLTSEEKQILVEANKDTLCIIGEDQGWWSFSHLATKDGSPFTYELAQKCCDRTNNLISQRNREKK